MQANTSHSDADVAIRTRGLAKVYRTTPVVDHIDLTVPHGQTFGFLGPNGAGKSTLISMLCTLAAPSAGQASVAGADVVSRPAAVRRRIGLVFQERTVDNELTARENLLLHADLYGVPRLRRKSRVDSLLELVDLAERGNDLVQGFSGGMKRRLEIARGMLHQPQVLFLDEPTLGLDPRSRAETWEHLRRLRELHGMTVFVTTHYLDEAEHCDRIAIIDRGRIVADGTPPGLKSAIAADRVELHTADDHQAKAALREGFAQHETADLPGGGLVISMPDAAAQVPRLCAELGVRVFSVTVTRPTLDDVFLRHTGQSLRTEEETTA
ncbi:ATP-binding cassette domain-containing protein [Saccharothrix sp. AJ9571]|nr:ATP-binding cassette domain-containing protein [Saccharothrix sp. AJ9571]